MKKKETKKIQWDMKAVKNFEGFLKQMYGEYGNVKFGNELYEHCTEIKVSQSTGDKLKVDDVKFNY